MSVGVASPPDLLGRETPRIWTRPLRPLTPETSLGFECIRFAEDVMGLDLLPWQRWFLVHALELRPDGGFRFRTVVLLVGRQSGKTTIAQVLTLWRLCMDEARTVLATAQNLDVANRTVADVQEILQATPELAGVFEKDGRAGGKFWFRLEDGCEMRAVTADRKGARSMTADLVFADELREHQSWEAWNAIEATISTRSRGMILATSNAGDAKSVVLKALRDQGLRSVDDRDAKTALFEWSAPEGCALDDRDGWAQALPGLGVTSIVSDVVEAAKRPGNENGFRTERLCQWVEQIEVGPFGESGWSGCLDPESVIADDSAVSLALDVAYDRSSASLAVAGYRADGLVHVELIAQRAGTEWVVDTVRKNMDRIGAPAVVLQGRGCPASSLRESLESVGVPVVVCQEGAMPASMGSFFDAVMGGRLRHRGQGALDRAAEQAAVKPLGDTWVWDRRGSAVDIAPLCAATFAAWGLGQAPAQRVSAYVMQGEEDDYRWW